MMDDKYLVKPGRHSLLALLIVVAAIISVFPITRLHQMDTNVVPAASGIMPACGMRNDQKTRLPTDWLYFTPPRRGESYVDPVFGCKITRLTDAQKDGVAEHHYYATLTPMSADDSQVLITDEHGDWKIIDPRGNVLVPSDKIPARNNGTLLWDATFGNIFYFTYGNAIMRATVIGDKVKTSTVHKFPEYRLVIFPDKTDLSIDGDSFAMWAGHTDQTGQLDIFTYNMKTNIKKTPYVTECSQIVAYIQGPCVHGITQTADDNVIIGFANDGQCQECGNRLWDGHKLSKIQDRTNHIDTGYDFAGKSIFVEMGGQAVLAGEKNPCASGWGLDVRELNDLTSARCLLDKQPSSHVSYRGSASQPWVAFSFFDDRKQSPEYFNNSLNFRAPTRRNWELYEDEIILVRIDGAVTYRLAHARSRSAESYWAQPHAAISRDGKYVVFDSNMAYAREGCPTNIEDCADVYLIKVR